MIAKATAIQHGQAMTNYATKNNRADIVKTNHLSDGLPPMGMWDEMVLHQSMFKQRYAKKPIELTSIRFELSPSEEEARNWTMEDWQKCLDEFIHEIDHISKVNHIGKRKGKAATSVKPTNIASSQYFAALHRDSKSGIPHLHLVVNRIDMNGNLNDVKFIGERAVMAAKAVNQHHGWKDAMDIREERIEKITNVCMDVLRSMPVFDWNVYANRLRNKGYDIELVRDKTGQAKVHGYRFTFGRTTIKASELGVGRNLTASKIENTFRKLHPQTSPVGQRPSASPLRPSSLDSRNTAMSSGQSRSNDVAQSAIPARLRKIIEVDGERFNIVMPRTAYDTMNSCIEVPENGSASHNDILNVAMLLFMNYLDAATSMSESCGGGGSSDSGWGRDKDEDDRDWARRCARQASSLCKPIKRGMRR
ncbi:relaxase/mobilization nuclease domain-containing protein [Bacteroides sp. CAG:530]|nr:relaxase/mobilization nuclease domain-containing protein [Bacteroides sp. CAG:530]